ncbi:CapA family protein [Isachenkonia alkalipeptolytica]|uniref:CapA family protein n=1 Tax=Isachenkonia alkalipeptolytica TaxID=2565777 RepID=UPI001371E866|nr:CapA family protein [Isachenkonia alkalipeptolytica]
MFNKKIISLLIILLIGVFLITGCNIQQSDAPEPNQENGELNEQNNNVGEDSLEDQENQDSEESEEVQEVEEFTEVTISAVGDVMVHQSQLDAQYDAGEDAYDFHNNFLHLKPYLDQSDINMANLETTFAGPERGYSSFPMFNTPDALGEALRDAGFQFISTINNHTYDTGEQGFFRTLEVLDDQGLTAIGTRSDESEKRYTIEEVENIKVGMTGYTYETEKMGESISLNGIPVPPHIQPLMNTFHDHYQEEDIKEMEEIIEAMKKDGADIIVFFLHWGNEYQREPSGYQTQLANKLSELGVDVIFGSHPHVVQPMDIIENDGHETLVVYSMGNLISNQREETLRNYTSNAEYTEDGLMVHATFEKSSLSEEIERTSVEYTPLWVHRYNEGSGFGYEVLPVAETIDNFEDFDIQSEDLRDRIRTSLERTEEIVLQNNDTFILKKDATH